MKKLALSACVLSFLLYSPTAKAVEALELTVSRLGDVELACGALSQEAFLMRDIIVTTEDIREDTKLKGHGIRAATGLGGFLVGTATGGVGFAAAGLLLNHVNSESGEEASDVQEIAKQRRALMMGIFNAKGCNGPMDHVMQDGMEHPDNRLLHIAAVEPASGEEKSDSKYQRRQRPEKQQPHDAPEYND